jgi:hypothetical protein
VRHDQLQREEDRNVNVPALEVDRVILKGPALWIVVSPDQWSMICRLAMRYGWSMSCSESEVTSKSEWTFEVRDESAIALSQALERA